MTKSLKSCPQITGTGGFGIKTVEWQTYDPPFFLQQTTVEEKSRVIQLEEELAVRKAEVEELQIRLQRGSSGQPADVSGPGLSSETLVLREQLLSAGREHRKESSQLRERYEASLSSSQKEVERLKAITDRQGQDISDLKQRLQQATRENMEMMDSWKAKLDALVGDHQRALEELKASLTGDRGGAESTGGEGEGTTPEMRAVLESLKMEQHLEVENLKAKHEIEAAVITKEREDLRARLQELRDQLEESDENWKIQVEAKSNQHTVELKEVLEKLQKAEVRIGELDNSNEERERASQLLKEQLELAEKKMVDYEALQKAEAQSRAEILSLQEKLRVSENRLQAVEADHTTQDVNVCDEWDDTLFFMI